MSVLKNITLLIILFLAAGSYSYAVDSWKFKVFYDESEIGEHVFSRSMSKENQRVTIEADFNIDIFFINVYSYKHRNIEQWDGECLISINSMTDDNGEKFEVNGEVQDNVFNLNTNTGKEIFDGCVKTFAYWDIDILDSDSLLNSQTGEIVDVDISFVANEEILVRNKLVNAKRYELKTDDFTIELWYSDKNEWVALNSITSDGAKLHYKIQ